MLDEEIKSKFDQNNVAAIYVDSDEKRRLVFTRDQLINQLQRVCQEINKSFDNVFKEEFQNLSYDLSEVFPVLFVGRNKAIKDGNKLLQTCGDLLWNSSNTIVASVQTLRCGFRLQSGALIRSVVEICATVVHLLTDPNILDDFLSDKLKSTKSISIADKQIPLFGMIWGVLSNKQMHINSLHADNYPLTEYKDKGEIPASITLGMLGATMMILAIVTELTFIHEVEKPKYWESLGQGGFKFIPPKETNWAAELLK